MTLLLSVVKSGTTSSSLKGSSTIALGGDGRLDDTPDRLSGVRVKFGDRGLPSLLPMYRAAALAERAGNGDDREGIDISLYTLEWPGLPIGDSDGVVICLCFKGKPPSCV